jgi:hypothetical protein
MKQYINNVWDLVDIFFLAFNISFVPREENQREDFLSLAASTFKPLIGPNVKYEVEVRFNVPRHSQARAMPLKHVATTQTLACVACCRSKTQFSEWILNYNNI